jgi:hypothetical protein
MRRTLQILSLVLGVVAVMAAPAPDARAGNLAIDLFNVGCEVTHSAAHGCFLTNIKGPGAAVDDAPPSKTGEACGWNLLALFTSGDVRITTAMANAQITRISTVDYRAFELIPGFYGFSRYCTVVTGE